MKTKKLIKFLKNPIKEYKKYLKYSIIPKPYSHQVNMNILIKKGQQSGTALIPCTIYAMDHSIDLNPALIRKKDKKIVKYFKLGEKIRYNSNDYAVELTEDEHKKGYVLKELERCGHCGQKLVISEVKQTRYRSCPSINVKLGDKAKEDTIIPVKFGINKSSIFTRIISSILIIPMIIIFSFQLFGLDLIDKINIPSMNFQISNLFRIILKFGLLGVLWLWLIPTILYGSYKLLQWYNSVKHTLRRMNYNE